jgi:hypothetical protein
MSPEEREILNRILKKFDSNRTVRFQKVRIGEWETCFTCEVVISPSETIEIDIIHTHVDQDTLFSFESTHKQGDWLARRLDRELSSSRDSIVSLSQVVGLITEIVEQHRLSELIESLNVGDPDNTTSSDEEQSLRSSGTTAASRRSSQSTTPSDHGSP